MTPAKGRFISEATSRLLSEDRLSLRCCCLTLKRVGQLEVLDHEFQMGAHPRGTSERLCSYT